MEFEWKNWKWKKWKTQLTSTHTYKWKFVWKKEVCVSSGILFPNEAGNIFKSSYHISVSYHWSVTHIFEVFEFIFSLGPQFHLFHSLPFRRCCNCITINLQYSIYPSIDGRSSKPNFYCTTGGYNSYYEVEWNEILNKYPT